MGVLTWLKHLLFVPVCRMCGKRQSIFTARTARPLCLSCAARWAQEMSVPCSFCARPRNRCLCLPEPLKVSRCVTLVKLADYGADRGRVADRLILRAKDARDRELFSYLASDLAMPSFMALEASGAALENAVVTWAPRRIGTRLAIGHDQARELARALSRALGCPCLKTLRRTLGSRQQKSLKGKERAQNAAASYRPVKGMLLTGKTVLLVDDVCTTGSTMAAATSLLYRAGAERVIGVCVAVRTPRGDEKKQ
jgi:ComF family protein